MLRLSNDLILYLGGRAWAYARIKNVLFGSERVSAVVKNKYLCFVGYIFISWLNRVKGMALKPRAFFCSPTVFFSYPVWFRLLFGFFFHLVRLSRLFLIHHARKHFMAMAKINVLSRQTEPSSYQASLIIARKFFVCSTKASAIHTRDGIFEDHIE